MKGPSRRSLHRARERVGDRSVATKDFLEAHPVALVAALATVLQGYAAARVYAPLAPGEWPVLRDSVIFEYIGWQLSTGARLYLDIWEIKPPLAFELTAVVALLAGDDVALYHALNLVATSGALVGGAAVAAAIVHELTDDPLGAVVGGLAVFVLPLYFWRALIGFKSKYFIVFLGLLVLWLLLRDRPLLAGVASAAVVGFWQLAVVFPLVGVAVYASRSDRTGTGRFVAGGLGTGAVVLAPVVAWGAFPAMVAETVLAPLLVGEGEPTWSRIQAILRALDLAIPVVLVGLGAYAGSLSSDRFDREWPLVAVTAWFTLAVLFLDFDTYPDLFPWFGTVAVGVGLAVGRGTGPSRRLLSFMVLGMVLLSVGTMGGFGTGLSVIPPLETYDTSMEVDTDPPYNLTERQSLFWNRADPGLCRMFTGPTQYQLVQAADLASPGERYWEAECGRFAPIWDAVVRKYAP